MLDLNKPLQTRGGMRVVDVRRSQYVSQPPITGYVDRAGRTQLCRWDQTGRFMGWEGKPPGRGDNSMYDLVNV